MHAKAQFAIAQFDGFDAVHLAGRKIERPPAVGLQVRIQISEVAHIHMFFQALVIEQKRAISRGSLIQVQQAQAGGLGARRR